MNSLHETLDGTNALQYSYVLEQHRTQQDDHHPMIGCPPFTVHALTYPFFAQSDLHVEIGPPAVTTELASSTMSSTIPHINAFVVNHPSHSSSTNVGRAVKVHPCHQCGKTYTRRALAEGCENRHQDLRPFSCTKRCSNQNWYGIYFLPRQLCDQRCRLLSVPGRLQARKSGTGTTSLLHGNKSPVPSG
jgi:hypothetical protein